MLGAFSAEEAVSPVAGSGRKCAVGGSEKRPTGQSLEAGVQAERSEGPRLLQAF